jgi:hypothetical protein
MCIEPLTSAAQAGSLAPVTAGPALLQTSSGPAALQPIVGTVGGTW